MKKGILFHANSLEEFLEWQKIDKKIFDKISKLIKEIQRTPYEGSGEPEMLRYELNNCWSRRISLEHRLIYEIKDNYIIIYSCKGHYIL